ncbi:hypothetical protein HPP92_005989 [Vanilla planifolia]|uniref:Uncharacterized protein n=1 Tax=Vanilla planifolia TaxID=51239 RepID=A0A835VFE2_VANPL|nr:hypothetical protein HPP92_005989 [Vanilla planifolia]
MQDSRERRGEEKEEEQREKGFSKSMARLESEQEMGELFFLFYTPFWLTICLGIIVPYKLYESFTEVEYLLLGLVSATPSFLIPLMLVGKADRNRRLAIVTG